MSLHTCAYACVIYICYKHVLTHVMNMCLHTCTYIHVLYICDIDMFI